MGFEKAIEHNKERKPYYDSRRFDRTCRHGGSCSYCENRRLYNSRKWKIRIDDEFENYIEGEYDEA
jgi:hypothetical protein